MVDTLVHQKGLNPEGTVAYYLAHQLTLEKTQKLRDEQLRFETQKAQHDSQTKELLEQKQRLHQEKIQIVAQAQLAQMQAVQQRKVQLQAEKLRPGINPEFSGYPSIPQTPLSLKRSRKLDQQRKLKAELELQVQEKAIKREGLRADDQRQASLMITSLDAQTRAREEEGVRRRQLEKAELWRAWKEAEHVKKEQADILHGVSVDRPSVVSSPALPKAMPTLVLSPTFATSLAPEVMPKASLSPRERGQAWRRSIAQRLRAEEDLRARRSLEFQRTRQLKAVGLQVASGQFP